MSKVVCPNCETAFNPREYPVLAAGAAGVLSGAYFGSSIGIVAGPLGGIAGTIPGAMVGGIVGLFGMRYFARCPECRKVFKRG